MNNYVVIAVDGPACSGKSTIARNLARSLGFVHVNSGALYRAVALLALRNGMGQVGIASPCSTQSAQTEELLAEIARSTHFEFKSCEFKSVEYKSEQAGAGRSEGAETKLYVNGVDEGSNLYTPEVSQASSRIAVYAKVREVLTEVQRESAKVSPLVLEGRDAGTVVFPNTPYKYYLDAALEVRAQRRLAQLEVSGVVGISLQEVTDEMRQRDERDMTRSVTPLSQAADAKVIDTSMLTEEQVVECIKKDVLCSSS